MITLNKKMKYIKLYEELTENDFNDLEDFADDLFSELGVDVVFTKHFKDRVNGWREERKPISYEELEDLFLRAYRNAGQMITSLPDRTEVVLRNTFSRLNSPVAVQDSKRDRKLIMQTIHRKTHFSSPNPIIPI
jgi:hypothetical protein